jgi:hypothetical protein
VLATRAELVVEHFVVHLVEAHGNPFLLQGSSPGFPTWKRG